MCNSNWVWWNFHLCNATLANNFNWIRWGWIFNLRGCLFIKFFKKIDVFLNIKSSFYSATISLELKLAKHVDHSPWNTHSSLSSNKSKERWDRQNHPTNLTKPCSALTWRHGCHKCKIIHWTSGTKASAWQGSISRSFHIKGGVHFSQRNTTTFGSTRVQTKY